MKIHMLPQTAPVGTLKYGVGWNWFDFLGCGGSYARSQLFPLDRETVPALDDETGWRRVFAALDDLRPGFIRFGLPPDPHIDEATGRIVTDTVHMERLERLNDWAVRNGCTVMLDTFLIPSRFEFAEAVGLSDGRNYVNMAAADNEAYAERFVAPLLRHVLVERELRSVRFFNPVNEPMIYGCYQTPQSGPDMYAHYVDMYRAIDAALRTARLRDRIQLVGIDAIGARSFCVPEFERRGLDIDPYVDAYSIHYYFELFDWMERRDGFEPICEGIDRDTGRWVEYCRGRGKDLLMAEVGSFAFGRGESGGDPAGPTRHEAALVTAETVLRGLNLGLSAAAVWALFWPDPTEGPVSDSWYATLHVRKGEVARCLHPYHTYRLLSRYARPGARIHPLIPTGSGDQSPPVHGTLLRGPDDAAAILLVNDHFTETAEVTLAIPPDLRAQDWHWQRKDSVRIAEPAESLAATDTSGGELLLGLTPMSLNVLWKGSPE